MQRISARPLTVLTASQVAVQLGQNPSWLLRKISVGEILPDGRAGNVFIFRASRIAALKRKLQRIEGAAIEVQS